MAGQTLRVLLDLIGRLLQDEDYDNWTETELLQWYNQATRQVVIASPDANVSIESVKLVAGVKQYFPSGVLSFLKVTRNMGTDGETPGETVTPMTMEILGAWEPDWSNATATTAIEHSIKEQGDYWYCYPPSDGTGYVEIEVARAPDVVVYDDDGEWESELVGVHERFINAVMELIMYFAYSKDTDFPGSEARAIKHYNLYASAVGAQPMG